MNKCTNTDAEDAETLSSLADHWCVWNTPGNDPCTVYVIEDDGGDWVRIEYTRQYAMMGVQYADVARSELSIIPH